jgi:hypothetical protein
VQAERITGDMAGLEATEPRNHMAVLRVTDVSTSRWAFPENKTLEHARFHLYILFLFCSYFETRISFHPEHLP